MATEGFNVFQTMTVTPRSFPEMELFDIEGNRVDVRKLATAARLILITLKSVSCPVCPQLLKYLNVLGLDPHANSLVDPFTGQEFTVEENKKKLYRLLLKKDANFMILCPGTNAEVREIQIEARFTAYHFISSEGGADQLVKALKVQLSEHEYMPAILEVSSDATSVNPISIGRGPGNYFHEYLTKHLFMERCREEIKGCATLNHAYSCVNQLKRRSLKCQEGSIAPTMIHLNLTLSKRLPRSAEEKKTELTELPKKVKEVERAKEGAGHNETPSGQTNSILRRLPSELIELILYQVADIPSLVVISAVSRDFYLAVCSVLTKCIREQIVLLKESLPVLEDGITVGEMVLMGERINHWHDHVELQDILEDTISCKELESRILNAEEVLHGINQWIERWKPRNRGRRRIQLH